MAYLPTVNETKEPLNVGDSIVKSLQKRLDFSSFVSKSFLDQDFSDKLVTKQDNTTNLLNKLYLFIVKDSYRQNLNQEEDSKDIEEENSENEFIQNTLIDENNQVKGDLQSQKDESFLSKLMKYFKYFSFGRMVYRNWDTISKILGLEKLTETIKSISTEFGITKIVDDIKTTINNIMDEFNLGSFKFDVGEVGPVTRGPKSINAADPTKVRQAMQFFIDKGLTPEQSAGIVGNMLQENPAFATDIGGDHGKAGGLFQWQGQRQVGMGGTFESQLKHMWDEMTGQAPTKDPKSEQALRLIKQAKTSAESAQIFSEYALRPGTPMMENRVGYAAGALELSRKPEGTTVSDTSATIAPAPKTESPQIDSKPLSFKPDIKAESPPIDSKTLSFKPDIKAESPPIDSKTLSFKPDTTQFESKSSPFDISNPTVTQPPRVAKNYAERGETGGDMSNEQRRELVNRDIATESDLKGLEFVLHSHGEDKKILKKQAQMVQKLKSALGLSSLIITCGYRPPEYNKELARKNKNVAKDSFHMYRKACDIAIPRGYNYDDVANFVRTASKVGFGGIGVYLKDGFIHVDIGPVRTWTHGLPKPIQDALTEHVSGRVGHQVIKDIPNIERPEPGETGSTNGTSIDQQKREQEPGALEKKDFLQDAFESYQTQLSVLSKVFNAGFSKQSIVRLESMMEQLSGEIPRKEQYLPDVSSFFAQNTLVVNNFNQNSQIQKTPINTNVDVPPIFANPFLSNYYKD